MKATIIFICQYQENKAWHLGDGSERWANKGAQSFSVEMDADLIAYREGEIVERFQSQFLKNHYNDGFSRCSYLSHSVRYFPVNEITIPYEDWGKVEENVG